MPQIGDIGEDALISLFVPRLPETTAALLGPGDDAAVLSLVGDLVVSSDVLAEGRHFRREWSTAVDVGFRAAMQNLSDIDAMGAVPVALQVTLAAPAETDVEWVLDFADGLYEACAPLGVGVIGGDISGANEIVVSVTALGDTHGRPVVRRDGARVHDVVAVSGALGGAAAGHHQLEEGLGVSSEAIDLFLRPRPRIGAGVEAAAAGATSMIDLSDGLVKDLCRIAAASRVEIAVDSDRVPIHPGASRVARDVLGDAREWALTGGEDHHLVATFPSRKRPPAGWVVIGRVTGEGQALTVDGAVPNSWGWSHFPGSERALRPSV